MNVFIYNNAGILNDYHFKSLCLLYFPEEKFPENEISPNKAVFIFTKSGSGYKCRTVIRTRNGTSAAEYTFSESDSGIELDEAQQAAVVSGGAFLKAGFRLFGFYPPWGVLTGLRPVKLARYFLEKGHDGADITELLIDKYIIDPKKSKLSVETARREIRMLKGITPESFALYISIPFCPTRCDYCSFVSYSNKKLFDLIPGYLERLHRDIADTAELACVLGLELAAIYIGGGTPSFLNMAQIDELLNIININFKIKDNLEYSFEAGRPDSVDSDKLEIIKSHGVNRVSINPQSTDDNILRAIGRKHDTKQFLKSAELALNMGFDAVNADLIAGLPGDSGAEFKKSLEDVIGLGFNNITVHTLSIKNAAEIKNNREFLDPVGSMARKCVDYAKERLETAGLYPYYLYRQKRTVGNGENVGYAVPGRENLYNVLMMEEYSTVLACGAGAITKLVSPDKQRIERIAFAKYPFEYLEAGKGINRKKIIEFYETYKTKG